VSPTVRRACTSKAAVVGPSRQLSRKHPVWSTKLIAATAIILDDENGSISVASASAPFSEIREKI